MLWQDYDMWHFWLYVCVSYYVYNSIIISNINCMFLQTDEQVYCDAYNHRTHIINNND